jgi:inhibitor of cysteine peptidase
MKNSILSILLLIVTACTGIFSSSVAFAATCNANGLRSSQMGQRGNHIRILQSCLISRGYDIRGGASGYYGVNTQSAVRAFYTSELGISGWNGKSVGPRARVLLGQVKKPTQSVTAPTTSGVSSASLKRIASATELQKYLDQSSAIGYYGRGFGDGIVTLESSADVAAPTTTATKQVANQVGGVEPGRVSTTNVQVSGIDEPDIVKTDGTTIYFSREQNYYYAQPMIKCAAGSDCATSGMPPQSPTSGVTAVTAFPLSSLGVASNSIPERGEMLLVKDKKILVILSYNQIVAYDISNPAKPVKKWTNDLKDNTQITTARLKGDTMYLVTSTYLNQGSPCPIVPMTRGSVSISIPCTNIWAPSQLEPVNTTYTVFAIDPTTGIEKNTVTYLADSSNTTSSMFENNLYIASRIQSAIEAVSLDFWKTEINDLVSSATRARIAEILGYTISTQSKLSEIASAINKDSYNQTESDRLKFQTEIQNRQTAYMARRVRDTDQTMITRIPLATLSVAATGIIPGHLLNQFSMDEYNNNLRIATTAGETWSGASINDVYILNSSLQKIGSVVDMGLTERIYSARFIGDRAYLVTFRQTDPFYVLDLSIPSNPKMVGELKIPGYSAYLEPLSDRMVLGVGREGGQVKMSLFDVTNPKNPVEKSKYTLSESWTEVEQNHHAFLRDAKHNVFFIPGGQGGYVISYAGDTLSLKATVALDQVKRAIYIEDMLYVIGQNQIVVVDENTWKEVKTLKLE